MILSLPSIKKLLKKTFFTSLVFLSIPLLQTALCADVAEKEPLFWGVLTQDPIYHQNGSLAWIGERQGSSYKSEKAFFHVNGNVAWDGMPRKKDTFGNVSEQGVFYYDNGTQAWGGIPQSLDVFGNHHKEGVFFHSNGEELWGGVSQRLDTFGSTREDAKFYYSNGALAWGGLKQFKDYWGKLHEDGKVFYSNGKLAWSGQQGDSVYDSEGKLMGKADYVWLSLENNSWLYVDYTGKYVLTISLGEGYLLIVEKDSISLQLYRFNLKL